jgi:hypothetical protein
VLLQKPDDQQRQQKRKDKAHRFGKHQPGTLRF